MPLSITKNLNLITIYSVLIVLPLIFLPTLQGMIHVWNTNDTFTHGFLIFPISAWLIWQKKSIINNLSAQIEYKTLIIVIPLFLFWYISYIVDVQITQQLSLILLIQSLIWLLLGRKIFNAILFPVLFLFFAIPFGQVFIPPLMEFTAHFTVALVKLTGIPIYQEGLFFSLPSGNWSVVDECSGVRYLIASVVLGTLFAYTSYSSKKKIFIFILISIAVPIIANGLRAFGIVMIGHYSGMTLAVGVDHLVYGWVFFGVIIFLLFFLGSYWADPIETFNQEPSSRAKQNTNPQSFKIIVSQLALFSILLISVLITTSKTTTINEKASLSFPSNFAHWQFQADRSFEWQPTIIKPDIFISKMYQYDQDLVQLNVGYYKNQTNGAEAISSANRVDSELGRIWKKMSSSDLKQGDLYVTETIIKLQNTEIIVWHWYQIGGFVTPSPYIAKLLNAYNIIFNNRDDAAMISIATIVDTSRHKSKETLKDFLTEASPKINKLIKQ